MRRGRDGASVVNETRSGGQTAEPSDGGGQPAYRARPPGDAVVDTEEATDRIAWLDITCLYQKIYSNGAGGRKAMKCQHCEKPATFHITELTEPGGPQILHLCEEHARGYLTQEATTPAASVASVLAKQLKLGQTADELAKLDQKECPVCGITFFDFRNAGRLGCPYDYTAFEQDLIPLLINIHDAQEHRGKRPKRKAPSIDRQAELIQLRREMEEAVEREDYERASEIRDQLRAMDESSIDPQGEE
jgi:protein arginine kinase activator